MNSILISITRPRKKSLQDFSKLLVQTADITREEMKQNRFFGTGFNPLQQFAIDERRHTQLIGNLLDPSYPHGQKCLFLKCFLRILDISLFDKGLWSVDTERGGVDILLKREHPHSVIVLENKSNYAVDQPGQLYRYWYEQICLPNEDDNRVDFTSPEVYEMEHVKNRYRLIYLAPATGKVPSDISLHRPLNYRLDKLLPEKLPMIPLPATFESLIIPWLEYSRNEVPSSNSRLREYLNMYIEYWKNK